MAYGIGSILGDVDQKAEAYYNKPDALAQMFQQNQQLVDLLALQKIKSDKEAAIRSMQMQQSAPAATIKDQRANEVMNMTKAEVAQQIAPGLQMAGQRAQQAQAPQAQGISSLPAPNMQPMGMAQGGIVGYKPGGVVEDVSVFTTPTGETLTRDDLIMMRNSNEIPQELLLTDSRGNRLTVSDAIMEKRDAREDLRGPGTDTQEDLDRRRAFAAIGDRRREPLEESPEDYLARRMSPMDNSIDFDARAEIGGEQPVGQIRRSGYSVGQEAKGNPVSTDEGGLMGSGLKALWEKMTTQSPEKQAAARAIYANSDAPRGVGGLAEPSFSLPSMPDVPSLYEMLGGSSEVANRRNAPQAQPPANEDDAYQASLGSTPPRSRAPTPTQPATPTREFSIEEFLATPTAAVKAAPPTIQNAYQEQLAGLRVKEEDKLDKLISFLIGAGASGGTNFGATMLGGATGVRARNEEVESQIAATQDKIEALKLKEREFLLDERQLNELERSNRAGEENDRQQNEAALASAIASAMSEGALTANQMADLRLEIRSSDEAQMIRNDILATLEKEKGKRAMSDPLVLQEAERQFEAAIDNIYQNVISGGGAGGSAGFTYLGAE